jgi:copper chaperone CopZ
MTVETITLRVVGGQKMHCGGCENTVQFTLKQLPGVQQVEASHKTQLLKLMFDRQHTDLERIQQELDLIGYQVIEVN